MKKSGLFKLSILMLMLSVNGMGQPYAGTIFIDPDIITSADSSTFLSATYTGQDTRTVYDRRVADWVTINAYLFDIVWNDGLTTEAQINPEFGSVAAATAEAEKYGRIIGRLPTCLRKDVDALWIHMGTELFGGGNNSILIHTGQSVLYEADGILEETLVHEASHTSLDAAHASATDWLSSQSADPLFISDYAESNPQTEDIAESFLTWLAVRQCQTRISQQDHNTITQTIPNRLMYFDAQQFDMFPLCVTFTGLIEIENHPFTVFPNPSSDHLNIQAGPGKELQFAEIFNLQGRLLLREQITGSEHTLTTGDFPKGIYLLIVTGKDGFRYTVKWVRN